MLKLTNLDSFIDQTVKVDFVSNMADTLGAGLNFTLRGVTDYGIILADGAVTGNAQGADNLTYFYPWNVVGRIALVGGAAAGRSAA